MEQSTAKKVEIVGKETEASRDILTTEALDFLVSIHHLFNERRKELLATREQRQQQLDKGGMLEFLPETKAIREGDWTIAPLPEDLKDRRVEITGPVNRKMVINALNSGAKTFMACFEDATSPTWKNMIEGQINMRDAIRKTISFKQENGKDYNLKKETAVMMIRPRGLHLLEKNVLIDGEAIAGSFFDFGLYFFHNAKELVARGTGPYFYLPKLESHFEARLWNDIFSFAEQHQALPNGTIKATVLIETIMAAFEMDEILYELKDYSAGLNCGRWDYIFSYIKRLRNKPQVILPDRSQVTMISPFMRAYTQLCIQTCHRRNAPAIGGMAAQIPIKGDEAANEAAFAKVREDKRREVTDGHDGTWVAHPGLVSVAWREFDEHMPTPNQIHRKREDVQVKAEHLLEVPTGSITEEGLRLNCNVSVQYISAWLRGNGAVPINHLMEDAATAEISRTQVWQWIRHPEGKLEDGRKITDELVREILQEELDKLKGNIRIENYSIERVDEAADLFLSLVSEQDFIEFLTLPGYEIL